MITIDDIHMLLLSAGPLTVEEWDRLIMARLKIRMKLIEIALLQGYEMSIEVFFSLHESDQIACIEMFALSGNCLMTLRNVLHVDQP